MTALVFILLSVACSLLIAHFFKVVETSGMNILHVLTVNYGVAITAALTINYINGAELLPDFPLWLWFFAFFTGFVFIANYTLFSKSTLHNGIGVSISAMRLSLLIPVLVSTLLFNEAVTFYRVLGFVMVLVSLGMLILSRRGVSLGDVRSHWLLIGVFILTGIADASMKVFEQEGLSGGTEAHFLALVFCSALLFGLTASLFQSKSEITIPEIKMGVFVGLPNLLTSIFLIRALTYADGVFVYPAVNVLIIIGGICVGRFFWKDKVSRLEAWGMFIAILALLFLV